MLTSEVPRCHVVSSAQVTTLVADLEDSLPSKKVKKNFRMILKWPEHGLVLKELTFSLDAEMSILDLPK